MLRELPARTRQAVRERDLLLHAAAVTFYAALAVVPLLLVVGKLASLIVGRERLLELAASTGQALPDALGADRVATGLLVHAVDLGWIGLLVAILPASLYGEGLRRAYGSLADVREQLPGQRGRLAVLPLLVVAPVLLLAVLAVTPLLNELFSRGAGPTALGIYVALNVDWLAISVPLIWSFRVVAPDPPPWRAAVVGGLATGAFVAGFLQGFVLFLTLPIDLGAPFAGLVGVGAATAVLLWMWLLHIVVLVGYVATRRAVRLRQMPVVERG